MADQEDFRQQLLAGTKSTGRDTPLVRVTAAAEHLQEQAALADDAVAAAERAVAKARDQLDAAEQALKAARAGQRGAHRDVERALRLLADVQGGNEVRVHAGVATGTGETRS